MKIDENLFGRVTYIQPLNTYNLFAVQANNEEVQVSRFQMKVLSDDVSSLLPNLPDYYLTLLIINVIDFDSY